MTARIWTLAGFVLVIALFNQEIGAHAIEEVDNETQLTAKDIFEQEKKALTKDYKEISSYSNTDTVVGTCKALLVKDGAQRIAHLMIAAAIHRQRIIRDAMKEYEGLTPEEANRRLREAHERAYEEIEPLFYKMWQVMIDQATFVREPCPEYGLAIEKADVHIFNRLVDISNKLK